MRLDMFASERHFVEHMAPIWRKLPASLRGDFIVPNEIIERGPFEGVDLRNLHSFETDVRRPVLVGSYGDVRRMRRMGRSRIAVIEHGAGQSYGGDRRMATNSSYAGGKDRTDVELFLVPNEYAAGRFRAAYPNATIEVVGCPKVDTLPTREPGPGPVVAISFHFPIHIIPETESAIGTYIPALPALARTYPVIGHGHPKLLDWQKRVQRYLRRGGITDFEPYFADVCRRADVYVCDNSSTIFEFAATGRPVVLLNAPQYRRDVSHGGRFWDWADVGVQCDRAADLVPAIAEALVDTDARRAAREAVVAQVYPYRGKSAQRAATAVTAWLRGRAEEAA